MASISINHWATLIAALVGMAIGAFWYSPLVFGRVWIRLAGISEPKGAMRGYIVGFLLIIVMSYAIAVSVDVAGAQTILSGALVGVFVWFGFVATVALGQVIWEGKPFTLYLINAGHYLISFAVMGGIVAVSG
jgi:hypothetical protein